MSESNPFVKSDYEVNQERRKDRFNELADKNRQKSGELYQESRQAVEHIPFGQPILVGHHSEARHRKALDKSWNKMGQSVQADNKAKHYDSKAESVGSAGIASDDPQALEKLETKLQNLINSQEIMKLANKQFKKGGWDAVDCLSDKLKDELKAHMARCTYLVKPFESYSLSNNNANIRRIKERIKSLKNVHNSKPIDFENDDFHMYIEEGRIVIDFKGGKPSEECRKLVKQSAFRWSRYYGHWQRKVTHNAICSAKYLIDQLKGLESCY